MDCPVEEAGVLENNELKSVGSGGHQTTGPAPARKFHSGLGRCLTEMT